jgi:hypoxanthine phosphoribosyltransferase
MCYFESALKPKEMKKRAKIAKKFLDNFGIDPLYVLGRGVSGILALPVFAEVLNAKIAVSRKQGDSSHAGQDRIECACRMDFFGSGSYVVVDDFCETGKTILEMMKHMGDGEKPKAIIFYCPAGYPSIEGSVLDESDWCDVPRLGIAEDGKFLFTKNFDVDLLNGTFEKYTVKSRES